MEAVDFAANEASTGLPPTGFVGQPLPNMDPNGLPAVSIGDPEPTLKTGEFTPPNEKSHPDRFPMGNGGSRPLNLTLNLQEPFVTAEVRAAAEEASRRATLQKIDSTYREISVSGLTFEVVE